MIKIDSKKEYDLNNMNVAAQNIQMGSYLKELENRTSASIATSGCAVIGTPPDTLSVSASGFITLSGSARYWDDLFFPLESGKQGQIDKPAYNYAEIGVDFPQADNTQIMYCVVQFPHSWAIGTSIYPHVHWKQVQSGSVVWKMDYKWFDIGGVVPSTFNTYVMSTPAFAWTSGSIHQLSSGSAPISGSSISGISSMMLFKVYRDDNTYTGVATAYHIDIHILKDSLGSHSSYVK
jgi:hypothetical protein